MKILITGLSGMLGSAIYEVLSDSNSSNNFYGISRSLSRKISDVELYFADLSQPSQIKGIEWCDDMDVVIHCAANVNLNDCEVFKSDTYNLHVIATRMLSEVFEKAKFIYISTDSVFGGNASWYSEEDYTYPQNFYAYTKFLGESEIRASSKYLVLRMNMYGFSKGSSGKSLFEWGYNSLQRGKMINGFDNVIFNPLSIFQLADIIRELIHCETENGIYHLGINEGVSKYDFLVKIAEVFNFDKRLIHRVSYEPENNEIRRPLNTTLSISKVSNYIDIKRFSLTSGLEEIKEKYYDYKDKI